MRDLELIADHSTTAWNLNHVNVTASADLVALAYDRNNEDVVNAITNLTEPTLRRQLERELAERIARYMRDKWGPCACLKLNASETKQRKEAQGMKGTRAQAFAFSGLASC